MIIVIAITWARKQYRTRWCQTAWAWDAAKHPQWINTPYPGGEHGDFSPAERYPDVAAEFGNPSVLVPWPGGFAVWNHDRLSQSPTGYMYDRVEIHDEQIPHGNHTDFLYAWMRIPVPQDKVNAVRDLSDSVTYDPLKKLVRARCHFMGANVATLVLAKRIATGEMTADVAKKAYGATVSETKDPAKYLAMTRELGDYSRAKTMGP